MAAVNGTAFFRGQSGRTYGVDIYIADSAGARITWDANGAAGTGSATFWTPPENVTLYDISVATGLATAVGFKLVASSLAANTTLRVANHLNTLNNRPVLTIGFAAGRNIEAVTI